MTIFWIDDGSQGTNKHHFISPPMSTVQQPPSRPKEFNTDIVVNLVRITRLSGDVFDGADVQTRAISDGRDLLITWVEGDSKTSLAIKEPYVQRMLGAMPFPNGAIIDVIIWDLRLQFRHGAS
jgi:hypothetical protein